MLFPARSLPALIVACHLLAGTSLCCGRSAGPPPCDPNGLEISMIPPFSAMPSVGRMEIVLLYRNCSGHPVTLQGVPEIHFFLSEAGAGKLETSGPAPIWAAFDFFTPGRPEDDRLAAPVVLTPG